MTLLDLRDAPGIECSEIVICVDRDMEPQESQMLIKNLGWVGFELTTLDEWSQTSDDLISPKWLFLSLES
jgi:hypothetical protein